MINILLKMIVWKYATDSAFLKRLL